jgi:hypothetical protein
MIFQVGDIVIIDNVQRIQNHGIFSMDDHIRSIYVRGAKSHIARRSEYNNNIGIITFARLGSLVWPEKNCEEKDNFYTWLSQTDGRQYWFCQDEINNYSFLYRVN